MSLSVSKRMASVKPSPTSAILALASELKAAGKDIISLGAGEPDFDTPLHIKNAAKKAIEDGLTKYTPIDGTYDLKCAIQAKFENENNIIYKNNQIIVSNGAKQCLFNICLSLLSEGDEAVICAPYWVSYPDMIKIAGAKPVILEASIEDKFKINPKQLEESITNRTRLLIINNPSNPTGSCYSKKELQALGKILVNFPNVTIVSDEIYEHIYWGDSSFSSFSEACPQLYDQIVTVNGVSKAYAMTGWRIGYAAGPKQLITAMKTIQSQSTSNPCSISQIAALAALQGNQSALINMTKQYKKRHDYIFSAINQIKGFECCKGTGSFYIFPRIIGALQEKNLKSDTELVELLIREANVACVPGSAFGAPGYIRLSFACSLKTLKEAVKRIKQVIMS